MRGKKPRITSLDLLTGLAAVADKQLPQHQVIEDQFSEEDEEDDDERLRDEFLDFKKKNEGSKIGGGLGRTNTSISPNRGPL